MSFAVFIAAGIYGTGGVVHLPSAESDGFEFAEGRRWMTAEAVAACEGARAAGADRIIVSDAHPTGLGLILEDLPADVRVIRSWPRPLGQVHGIDRAGAQACILLGQVARVGSETGLLARSFSSEAIRDVRIDGVSRGEAEVDAMVAGSFGIPVVLVSGEAGLEEELRPLLGDTDFVATKHAVGLTSARVRPPAAAAADIRAAAEQAVQRRSTILPLPGACTNLEVEFSERIQPELLALLPGVNRIGPYSVSLPADNIVAARKWLTFVTGYLPAGLRRY